MEFVTSLLLCYALQLPLPYLKVGYLTAPLADDPIAPHKHWERSQFILNHAELQQVVLLLMITHSLFMCLYSYITARIHLVLYYWVCNHKYKVNDSESAPVKANALVEKAKRFIKVDVADIVSVSTCSDLTLPPGAGLCINTTHGPVFLVCTSSSLLLLVWCLESVVSFRAHCSPLLFVVSGCWYLGVSRWLAGRDTPGVHHICKREERCPGGHHHRLSDDVLLYVWLAVSGQSDMYINMHSVSIKKKTTTVDFYVPLPLTAPMWSFTVCVEYCVYPSES